jgi:protein-tyrosine phosphatase
MNEDLDLRDFLIAASRGGGRNFREIAGLATNDGRRVAHGRLYRSGCLVELPEESRATFGQLGVRTVVTLQTAQELDILGHPLTHLEGEIRWEHIPIGDRWFQAGGVFSDGLPSMGEFYVKMVKDHASDWARFLRLFGREESYAIVFHCTAGRDRTGVAAALVLEMLGVPRETIVADYLVSNAAFTTDAQKPTVLEPLFGEIDRVGGIEAFLDELGVSSDEIERAREHLLVGDPSLPLGRDRPQGE